MFLGGSRQKFWEGPPGGFLLYFLCIIRQCVGHSWTKFLLSIGGMVKCSQECNYILTLLPPFYFSHYRFSYNTIKNIGSFQPMNNFASFRWPLLFGLPGSGGTTYCLAASTTWPRRSCSVFSIICPLQFRSCRRLRHSRNQARRKLSVRCSIIKCANGRYKLC